MKRDFYFNCFKRVAISGDSYLYEHDFLTWLFCFHTPIETQLLLNWKMCQF